MINVYYLSLKPETPCNSYWDYGLINEIFSDNKFKEQEVRKLPVADFGIVVLPARHHSELVFQVNDELNKLKSVVLFLMGDEEADFPIEEISHDKNFIYVQNPKPNLKNKYRKLGCGYPQSIKNVDKFVEKDLDWFFSGQVTHDRREKCVEKLEGLKNGKLLKTEGFTQGYEPEIYYKHMSRACVCPCPAGPITVDTFRLFEALELGCVPIADNETTNKDWSKFWEWLFEEPVPFPTINDYDDLPGYIQDCVKKYPVINNRVQAWWIRAKMKLKKKISADIQSLTDTFTKEKTTIIIPVSPIKSHPDIYILEETIKSIRYHFPSSEIILTFDGVRKEQEDMKEAYEKHIRKVLWESRKWGNITPIIFEEHKHQSGMMRSILDKVDTPLILYVEQDTPLVTDEKIDWQLLETAIIGGKSNVIRLHHEGVIPKEHKQLMIGKVENKLLKTYQWSSRPHLASVAFYRRMIGENFSSNSKCFIEDLIHGKLQQAYLLDGRLGWEQWRVHIYIPDDKNIKRSYTTDGRDGGKKYDDSQIW